MWVFYSTYRLVHIYPTVSDYASEDTPTGTSYEQRQELTEDYKSCYKQSTLPCSSEFPLQSLLIPYNTLGISHQNNCVVVCKPKAGWRSAPA